MRATPSRTLPAGALLALLAALPAGAGIDNSRHDLSAGSASPVKSPTENRICVFCHTPHRALRQTLLWNQSATAQAGYTWGRPATIAGTTLPASIRPESKRCLDCHDGTVALGETSAGRIPVSGAGVDASGRLVDPFYLVGQGGDLSSHHPVSIPYAGQSGYNGLSSGVPPAKVNDLPGGYFAVTTAGCVNTTGVCTTAAARPGADGHRINLVPNAPGSTTNVGIECISCHEPHNRFNFQYMTRLETVANDDLCYGCHYK